VQVTGERLTETLVGRRATAHFPLAIARQFGKYLKTGFKENRRSAVESIDCNRINRHSYLKVLHLSSYPWPSARCLAVRPCSHMRRQEPGLTETGSGEERSAAFRANAGIAKDLAKVAIES
jgi:hypothetical protein